MKIEISTEGRSAIMALKTDLLNEKKEKEDVINNDINSRWSEACKVFIQNECPFKVGQVVKMVGNGQSSIPKYKRKYKELAIFDINLRFIFKHPTIILTGWWLNDKRECQKWSDLGHTIAGIANPDVFELSENQSYFNPHALEEEVSNV